MRQNKIVRASEAIRAIKSGSVIAAAGFVGNGTPEELLIELESSFVEHGLPRDLTLLFSSGLGDGKERGLNRLAHPGLLKRVVAGHYGLMPKIGNMALQDGFEAYNLPQGILTNFYRAVAAKTPGVFSRVGLGTFVDPRHGGGKVNSVTTEELIQLMTIDGQEWLFMKTFPINVAIIRGTTADTMGNITMEKEVLTLDTLEMAQAVHNCGGIVIAQVERIASPGSLAARQVKVPGILVDYVVVARPENHLQTYVTPYNPAYAGEIKVPLTSLKPQPLDERKIIARRAALELHPHQILNLGIGVPEGVASVANEEKILNFLTMTVEPGIIGGMPASGLDFGAAVKAEAVISMPDQFNFYDGGGLDLTCLGMAECDEQGNVNSSRFNHRLAGCGGFINISQNAEHTIFVGTMTAGGLEVSCDNEQLTIVREGKVRKFRRQVEQVTFSGTYARQQGKRATYITERCVFELRENGLHLTEVAPGVDIERDIFGQMDFHPIMDQVRTMDPRIFRPAAMGIRREFLEKHILSRISFHAPSRFLHVNFQGLEIETEEDIVILRQVIEAYCRALPCRPKALVNYDSFKCAEDVLNHYCDLVQYLASTYYADVGRYASNGDLQSILETELPRRQMKPGLFASRAEAEAALGGQ